MALFIRLRPSRATAGVSFCSAVKPLPRKENATAGNLAQSKKRHQAEAQWRLCDLLLSWRI